MEGDVSDLKTVVIYEKIKRLRSGRDKNLNLGSLSELRPALLPQIATQVAVLRVALVNLAVLTLMLQAMEVAAIPKIMKKQTAVGHLVDQRTQIRTIRRQ